MGVKLRQRDAACLLQIAGLCGGRFVADLNKVSRDGCVQRYDDTGFLPAKSRLPLIDPNFCDVDAFDQFECQCQIVAGQHTGRMGVAGGT